MVEATDNSYGFLWQFSFCLVKCAVSEDNFIASNKCLVYVCVCFSFLN